MSYAHRLARRDDLAQIVAIYNATIASEMVTADTEPVTVESRVAWFNEHAPGSRPLWVCTDRAHDERVLAWLSFSSFYGRPAYAKTAEISVYVHESQRRQGLATCLVETAIADAPSLGVDTLLGFIFAHNTPSLSLFVRLGFERWGYLPGVAVLDDAVHDLVIVGRRV
ncbi:MAG: N-acetyltransferase family protein [Thermoleophilia bacterium]